MAEITAVTFHPRWEYELAPQINKWTNSVVEDGASFAKIFVNVDLGFLMSTIASRLEEGAGPFADGVIEATADYALWQELEPGESTEDGTITRKRSGGKPYLRPGLMAALRKAGVL